MITTEVFPYKSLPISFCSRRVSSKRGLSEVIETKFSTKPKFQY